MSAIHTFAQMKRVQLESKLEEQASSNAPTGFFSSLSIGKYYDDRKKWRETFCSGFEKGYIQALDEQPISGQKVDTLNMTPKQEKFYEEFLKLASEYNCKIEFHSNYGMIITDLRPEEHEA